ncbi:adenosylcobinamide-phosphate synthase CbiB [Azohydromonas caseinilytica]|uniref:Cobalamin biosynthesis protein CobD n=1 Tax=Azohydromonas caseinilytica TaxID=2728836 RepID=A0A848FCJ0_9BURK|nr:adenosylcobinamide-phosphate synthase CbiB [Azohydromonas caseinilytica]NML16013.1 cobalamin biosynthesis protein CobD [Azohydromonas caseinilytica]
MDAVAALAVVIALAVDRLWGEPPARAHPVVYMGKALGAVGPALLKWRPVAAFLGGALAWLLGAAGVAAIAWALELGLRALPWWAAGPLLGLLLKPLLAWRMLRDEVRAVEAALAQSLEAGRAQLSRLVSRDTSQLQPHEVREAAIETLAENLNDSVVAPLFWFTVAGLPGAALYRWANTADAMWGYRGRWEWVGKFAARADDALSWLPARLTALLLCLAARRWPAGLAREARVTPSPNGGWPMGAMALLLGVRLSKPGVYALHASGAVPRADHTRAALAWSGQAVAAGAALLAAAGLWLGSRAWG